MFYAKLRKVGLVGVGLRDGLLSVGGARGGARRGLCLVFALCRVLVLGFVVGELVLVVGPLDSRFVALIVGADALVVSHRC